MESNRILLSDTYAHSLYLTEQDIGIVLHALSVLQAAFSLEPEYLALIDKVGYGLNKTLEEKAEKING